MATESEILNRLLEYEAMRATDVAVDYILELDGADLDAAARALGQLFSRGTPGQMRFAAGLFSPFQNPRGRLRLADLIAGVQRDDRPRVDDFDTNVGNALLVELERTRDVVAAASLRDVRLGGAGATALAAIFLLLDPATFWSRFDEWPEADLPLAVGHILPALDRETLARVESDLAAHRDRFPDAIWSRIQDKLTWRRETLASESP